MNPSSPKSNPRKSAGKRTAKKGSASAPRQRVRRANRKRNAVAGSISTQVNPILPAAVPQQSSGQRHETRLCARRELVQQVVGTSAFTAVSYPINAGLGQMFAWLASDAKRFEKYRFRRLAFEYVNSVGPADATNAGGNVCMAIDYDVLDPAPATLQAMNQNESAKLFSPYDKVRMELDPADLMRRGWLYTRSGGVPSGADAKTYDLGSFILAQTGTSTNGLGNIFVDYIVELDVPQEVPIDGQKLTGSAGLTASVLFGTDSASTGIPNWTVNAAGTTLTCAVAGEYIFNLLLAGTTLVCTAAGSAVGGTATSTEVSAVADPTGTIAMYEFLVRASVGQTIAPTINSAATVTNSQCRVGVYKYTLA